MLPLASLALLLATAVADPVPTWGTDLEQARQLAKKTAKPIFLVFRCEH